MKKKKGETEALQCLWCCRFSDSEKRVNKETENGKVHLRYCSKKKGMVEMDTRACSSFETKTIFWCKKKSYSEYISVCLKKQENNTQKTCRNGRCPQGKRIAWVVTAAQAIKSSPVRFRQREGVK